MSSMKRKRKPKQDPDTTGWVLGTIIVLLATLDLLVWASLSGVPNPISKAFADYGHAQPRVVRTAAH
jgi:hypothetical protein